MANANFDPSDDRYARGLIRRKINQLIGRAGFTRQDREDLEQEILTRLLQSLRLFDPSRAHPNTFSTTVVERFVANLLRNKLAEKRDHRRICSINVVIEISEERSTELAQLIGEKELDARLGRKRRSEQENAELKLDLAEHIAKLPKDWQVLLELLKTRSISEIARETGVPRTTVHARLHRIRQLFEQKGLRDYLDS